MAFITIPSASIEVGDPLKKELFDLIKENLDDHETRIQAISSGAGKVALMNIDILIPIYYSGTAITGALFYEVIQDCSITEGAIQLFNKSPATTGSITVDVKKNTTTDPSGFTSVFSTLPTIDVSTAPNYTRNAGVINPAQQNLVTGNILRLDITSIPTSLQGFRINLIGEIL